MKNYTISISGRGVEVYCHKLNPEQRNKLNELSVDGVIKNDECQTASSILGVDDLFMENEGIVVFMGADENDFSINIAECSPDDFYNDTTIFQQTSEVSFVDMEFAYNDDYLFAINRVKGTFGIYSLELNADIDLSKISVQKVDMNFQIQVLTDIFYDGVKLNFFDGGDTSSSSVTLLLKKNRV